MSPTPTRSSVILISDDEEEVQESPTVRKDGDKRPPAPDDAKDPAAKEATENDPETLKAVCSKTPYCLYADMGLELDKTTCAVLIGYFDCLSGISVVRRLNTLRINQSGNQTKTTITTHTANAAAELLVDLLKSAELPLENLSVFYCNIPDPEVNWKIAAKLKEFNPHLVYLGGLAGLVGGACQTGFLEYYGHVVELVNDVHFFALPEWMERSQYDHMQPIATQYGEMITVIQAMASNWLRVEEHFKDVEQSAEQSRLHRIRSRLQEQKVRLDFVFLSHALGTFLSFQDLQGNMARDMVMELQMTALLINVCAKSILTAEAAEGFVERRDLDLLRRERHLLPAAEINVGLRTKRYLASLSQVELGDGGSEFLLRAQCFYQTILTILMESLPGQLSPVSMRNIGILLMHPTALKRQDLPLEQVVDLGSELGVCRSSASISQLSSEYRDYVDREFHRSFEAPSVGLRWLKVLNSLGGHPILFKLVLTLLAFPRSLQLKHIFQLSGRSGAPQTPVHRKGVKRRYRPHRLEPDLTSSSDEEDHRRPPPNPPRPSSHTPRPSSHTPRPSSHTPRPSSHTPRPSSHTPRPSSHTPRPSSHTPRPSSYTPRPSSTCSRPPSVTPSSPSAQTLDTEDTEHSSDVVEVTDVCKLTAKAKGVINHDTEAEKFAEKFLSQSVYVVERDGVQRKRPQVKPSEQGELVLISLEDSLLWPAVTVPSLEDQQEPDMRKVVWYGHGMTSEVSVEYLRPFADFSKFFSQNTFATVASYKDAVLLALREASARCQKQLTASFDDTEEILVEMLNWAFGGFKPTGPKGFAPAVLDGKSYVSAQPKISTVQTSSSFSSKVTAKSLPKVSVSLYKLPMLQPEKPRGRDSVEQSLKRKNRAGWKGKRKKITVFRDGFQDTDQSPNYVPYKKRPYTRGDLSNKGSTGSVYKQPDQRQRERIIRRILDFSLDIDDYCVCCGTEDVDICHPLFRGSLCSDCKNNFTETLYRYDEDGYQSYCTICCYGMEVILCGNESCCRSYCADCLDILVADGTFSALKDMDPWICYMCQPHGTHGALTPRADWSIRVQQLFANDSAMMFEPHRVYPSIPASQRRPIRVLSLFDGVATGYVVLKDLGFKVEKYVASEVCDDSIAVATVNHEAKIIHVGDARLITQEHLDQWGPFDLLIGGSPCNDLSIVNPLRKGIYEGTGRLFFDYYRILQLLKPKGGDSRPFFWLFENVVFMNVHDRINICRFLECNPVLVDAVKVSPANRARCFWGNIPGMSRPITASQTDKLNLQDCLEIGRVARMVKVRTITTNPNSLKQGKHVSLLPVMYNGTEDTLWITEIEKIFGFPKHYTDVRNMNRQQRQKVLGKAWSVPVIRHLFAPLKDYFACEELSPVTSITSTSSTIISSSTPSCSSPSSPATPDALQLR